MYRAGFGLDYLHLWSISAILIQLCRDFFVGGKATGRRIPKGQSKMDNPEKLATQATQDEEKNNRTQYVLDTAISKSINTNNVN